MTGDSGPSGIAAIRPIDDTVSHAFAHVAEVSVTVAAREVDRTPDGRHGEVGPPPEVVREIGQRDVTQTDILRVRCVRGRRLVRIRVGPELEQRQSDHHRRVSVGDRVVQLQQEGGLTLRESLDERRLPQRTIGVEIGEAHPTGIVEQTAPAGTLGQPIPPQVEIEVEVRIDGEARGREGERSIQRPHAQSGDEQTQALDARPQTLPVRCTVEHGQGNDGRAHRRITAGGSERRGVPPAHLRADEVVHA